MLLLPWPGEDEGMEAMAREALTAGAKVELVSGEAAARVVAEGGVVARLFYPTPAALDDDFKVGKVETTATSGAMSTM